jgi:putative lipoic acid-binding regulatory protein
MQELTPEQIEALFPADCHFKVIAWDQDGMQERLDAVLASFGIPERMRAGARSAAGTYITYNISLRIETHANMQALDTAFRAVDGVRMVL